MTVHASWLTPKSDPRNCPSCEHRGHAAGGCLRGVPDVKVYGVSNPRAGMRCRCTYDFATRRHFSFERKAREFAEALRPHVGTDPSLRQDDVLERYWLGIAENNPELAPHRDLWFSVVRGEAGGAA